MWCHIIRLFKFVIAHEFKVYCHYNFMFIEYLRGDGKRDSKLVFKTSDCG